MVAVCEKVITQVGNVSDYMLHPPGINLLQVFLPVNPIISVRALTPNEEAAHLYSLPVLTPKLVAYRYVPRTRVCHILTCFSRRFST